MQSKSEEQLTLSFSDVSALFYAYKAWTCVCFATQSGSRQTGCSLYSRTSSPSKMNFDCRILCRSLRFTQDVFLQCSIVVLPGSLWKLVNSTAPRDASPQKFSLCSWSLLQQQCSQKPDNLRKAMRKKSFWNESKTDVITASLIFLLGLSTHIPTCMHLHWDKPCFESLWACYAWAALLLCMHGGQLSKNTINKFKKKRCGGGKVWKRLWVRTTAV